MKELMKKGFEAVKIVHSGVEVEETRDKILDIPGNGTQLCSLLFL